jgi:hypothetical protein
LVDHTPILSARLVEESGESIHGRTRDRRETRSFDGEAFLDELASAEQIGPFLKNQDHGRKTKNRLGANRLQPRNSVQRILERHGDKALDFFGGETGSFGLDFDQRRREFRNTSKAVR